MSEHIQYDTDLFSLIPLRRYKFIFFVNYPALFLFSPVISADGLKDVTTSGIQKKYPPKI